MGYQNGAKLLPPSLLEKVQQYVQGESIYIPKAQPERSPGQPNAALQERNAAICLAYQQGTCVQKLSETYFLSPQAIYKILSGRKK